MTSLKGIRALYLCYFGIQQPLVQTQVLPYLQQLARCGARITLLTFEPVALDQSATAKLQARLRNVGIDWEWRRYHRKPGVPATFWDILVGASIAARFVGQERRSILHARSHIPLAMALLARTLRRSQVVFDIRGLMAEEYVDGGVWRPGSMPYRLIKWLEALGVQSADGIVVLTERFRTSLQATYPKLSAPIAVIPCCVRADCFNTGLSDGDGNRREVVYSGSVTGLYLLREMAQLFKAIQSESPNVFFRVLTTSQAGAASQVITACGVPQAAFSVERAEPAAVPRYLERAMIGLSFRLATPSQVAASPTKIPEYLAAGVPVICNAGTGDMDELIRSNRVGVVLPNTALDTLTGAVPAILELCADVEVASRCKRVARECFDLETVGAARYSELYSALAGHYPGCSQ